MCIFVPQVYVYFYVYAFVYVGFFLYSILNVCALSTGWLTGWSVASQFLSVLLLPQGFNFISRHDFPAAVHGCICSFTFCGSIDCRASHAVRGVDIASEIMHFR